MSNNQLSKDSKFQDFIGICNILSPCSPAASWMDGFDENTTCGEAVEKFLATPDANEGWATWVISALYNHLSDDYRLEFFKKIADPMSAFRLYVDLSKLTDAEEYVLESVFKGKLPTAEKELEVGVIKRVKQ